MDTNEVQLTGRLPTSPQARELPSGDTIWSFRLVVRRPEDPGRRASVDTVECAAYGAGRCAACGPGRRAMRSR